eukprot:COSAG03_NODE_23277_length_281_cov_0.961538_1_plen_31_part_10
MYVTNVCKRMHVENVYKEYMPRAMPPPGMDH